MRGRAADSQLLAVDNPLAAAPVTFLRPERNERPAPIGTESLVRIAVEATQRSYRIAHVTLDEAGTPLSEDDEITVEILSLLRQGDGAAVVSLLDEGTQEQIFLRFLALEDLETGLHLTVGRDGIVLLEGPLAEVQSTVHRFVDLLNDRHSLIGLA